MRWVLGVDAGKTRLVADDGVIREVSGQGDIELNLVLRVGIQSQTVDRNDACPIGASCGIDSVCTCREVRASKSERSRKEGSKSV